jgi:hypothetical protein
MKVLVVRQPWAWLIVNGGKDIENRTWKTKHRGPLLIQASAGLPSKADMEEFRKYAARRGVKNMPEEFERGGIVGMVHVVDCVDRSKSKWFEGVYGFVLEKRKKLPFVPMTGKLGLFDAPPRVLKRLGLK